MKTPADKRIILTFHSIPSRNAATRWKARVVFEPSSTDDTVAAVTVVDGAGAPVKEGVLELAGLSLAVKDGCAAVRCGDFVKGKHSIKLRLVREGLPAWPGVLTFE
ncbi:MAG: hypothetical protein J6T01_03865 [Kiritimatiellae bacterium]|nr:hypothetical protein [Kiritimatiellia bacterium]